MRSCSGCRYWSELIAISSCGEVAAMCLNKEGPRYIDHTRGHDRCRAWQSGHLGAIDDPGQNPARYEIERQEP